MNKESKEPMNKEPELVKNQGEIAMAQFRPFEMDSIPIEEQFMNWKEIVKPPYDKKIGRCIHEDPGNSNERD